MEILFWILIATVTWCYAGYPLFIATLARLRPRALRPSPIADFPLRVTVVVAVRNEKASLARRIDNLLQQVSEQQNLLARQTREVTLLKTDVSYLETIARDRLDLMKEGETIFRLETPRAKAKPIAPARK